MPLCSCQPGERSLRAVVAASQMEAVRAVIDADVGRRTRANLTSAAMVSVAPEPDLARVNAGTGSQLQLDAVWCVA